MKIDHSDIESYYMDTLLDISVISHKLLTNLPSETNRLKYEKQCDTLMSWRIGKGVVKICENLLFAFFSEMLMVVILHSGKYILRKKKSL